MHKLSLSSVNPADLVKGNTYLCGDASLVDEIDWMLCRYDGKNLVRQDDHPIPPDQEKIRGISFVYYQDNGQRDWLIFELPDNGPITTRWE